MATLEGKGFQSGEKWKTEIGSLREFCGLPAKDHRKYPNLFCFVWLVNPEDSEKGLDIFGLDI
ncbi:MAG: hypothetical protein ACLR0U_23270 [Enterocloster clostridioformis]